MGIKHSYLCEAKEGNVPYECMLVKAVQEDITL